MSTAARPEPDTVVLDAVVEWWADWPGHLACRGLAVGVSGGVDSVVLLHALHSVLSSRGVEISVAHLDHGLRGASGAADRRFVVRLARRLGLRYRTAQVDVAERAARSGESIEMAARHVRYAFFRRAAKALGAQAVAVGHTRDDQAETLLLRLARGTGPGGLGGMAPDHARDGLRVVRPLLDVPRAAVMAFALSGKLRWREDATNRERVPQRNRVRLDILPLIRDQLNPNAAEALARTAGWLREEHAYMESAAADARTRCVIGATGEMNAVRLVELAPCLRRRVWRQWLADTGVPGARIDAALLEAAERLLAGSRGSRWVPVCGALRLERVYDRLRLVRAGRAGSRVPGFAVAVPGLSGGPQTGWRMTAVWKTGFIRRREDGFPPVNATCRLSAEMVRGRILRVRGWRPGDRLAPLGMEGSRKLQDIFGEARVPRAERSSLPVVVSGSEVVWLPGYRIARNWAVPSPRARALELVLERM